ncbi:ferredoxin [Streptomyces sp. Ru87]|uniref:Ferredoxin n=1 Tax=Streptomyces lycii TaxID=2654337 RepID=A0ABQ7FK41_9ACTN|nr:ferredoxin [Streptomyces lycii]PGH51838.1 ferredoxin [Streptomyces sp. Ru87]
MRVRADRDRCAGAGMCVLTAPEVFDQDEEDGLVVLLRSEPAPGHRAAARRAAGLCPAGAITLGPRDAEGRRAVSPESGQPES